MQYNGYDDMVVQCEALPGHGSKVQTWYSPEREILHDISVYVLLCSNRFSLGYLMSFHFSKNATG